MDIGVVLVEVCLTFPLPHFPLPFPIPHPPFLPNLNFTLTNQKTAFAVAESKALIAALIGRYEFKSIQDENIFPEVVWGITAKVLGGLDVEVKEVEGW